MASTYSTSLKIQLMGNGEDSGTWGSITNTNWNLMEQAVAGVQTITMSNANYTLSNLNGVSDEARNLVLVVNGTNSAIYQVIAPLAPKFYVISNQTVGGYAITIGGATGSLITIPTATTVQVYCDGTNFYSAQTSSAGNFNINGNLTVSGTSTLTGATTIGSTLQATTITATTQFSGPGTGLTGTATSLNVGGSSTKLSVNAGANTIFWGWSGSNITFQLDGTNYNSTLPCGISGNAATATYATTAGTANAYNTSNDLICQAAIARGWVYANSGGGGGDAMILLRSSGSVGQVDAVNLANNTYRWMQLNGSGPVMIGQSSPAGSASLTIGTSNGNGAVYASSALSSGERGWAMINSDGCFGGFFFPNAGNYFVTNLLGSQIGISFFFSDIRTKEEISTSTQEILPLIEQIEFIDYKNKSRKEDESSTQVRQTGGVSAQQLQTIKPEWVEELPDGGLMLNAPLMLTNAYKAIQELNAKVAALEAQIAK